MPIGVERFLDEEGRLKSWPAKQAAKLEALTYLATKFEYDRDYTEKEVNAILSAWHSFGDFFLLRRGLVDAGWMCRERDGSRYWKNPARRAVADEQNPTDESGVETL